MESGVGRESTLDLAESTLDLLELILPNARGVGRICESVFESEWSVEIRTEISKNSSVIFVYK